LCRLSKYLTVIKAKKTQIADFTSFLFMQKLFSQCTVHS